MYSGTSRRLAIAALGAAIALWTAGCTREQATGFNPMAGMTQEPEVSTIIMRPQTVRLEETLSGRLESSRKAEVRARVPGVLQKRLYKEGGFVKKGDKLFVIDDAPFLAMLNKAKANYANAAANLERMRPLGASGAVSKQALDQARLAYDMAKADLETARINYGHAHVTAPISGRISRSMVPEGALVGQGVPTLLATISQDDPLYMNVTRSSSEYLKMKRQILSGAIDPTGGGTEVDLRFDDGTPYDRKGRLLFTDPTIDEVTSNVTLKVEVPNPPVIGNEPMLMAGMFMNATLRQNEIRDAYVVPKEAVSRNSKRDLVHKVKDDGSFEQVPVNILREQGGDWIVDKGIEPGDRIMVTGFAKMQPGMRKVKFTDIDREDIAKVRFSSEPERQLGKKDGKAQSDGDDDAASAAEGTANEGESETDESAATTGMTGDGTGDASSGETGDGASAPDDKNKAASASDSAPEGASED